MLGQIFRGCRRSKKIYEGTNDRRRNDGQKFANKLFHQFANYGIFNQKGVSALTA